MCEVLKWTLKAYLLQTQSSNAPFQHDKYYIFTICKKTGCLLHSARAYSLKLEKFLHLETNSILICYVRDWDPKENVKG